MGLDSLYSSIWQDSFYQFAAAAWPILEPSVPWRPTWYRKAVAEHLQALWEGQFNRLLITIPPQSGKSTMVTKLFPVWTWLHDPGARALFASYSFESLAVPMSIQRRRLVESAWFQKLWGDRFKLSPDDNLKWRYSNDHGGHHVAVTGATGIGGDMLLVDDPHSADEARSDADRNATISRFRQTLMPRLTPGGRNLCVVVCQRLHELDLAGELMDEGGWKTLCLPSVAERDEKVNFPISQRSIVRKKGSLLDQGFMNEKYLELKKIELGPYGFSAQYQQSPAPAEGIIFNPEWWKRYTGHPKVEMIAVSVDAAFKEGRDQVAVQVWGFAGPRSWLLAKSTMPMGYVRTKETIRMYTKQYPVNVVLIEQAANGAAIVEELSGEFPTVGIPAIGSKEARAQACAPQVAAGFVYIHDDAEGNQFILDAAKFPLGKNDHDIDAMSQALNWRRENTFGLLEYYREAAELLAKEPELTASGKQLEAHAHVKLVNRPRSPLVGCPECHRTGTTTTHNGMGYVRSCAYCRKVLEVYEEPTAKEAAPRFANR